VVEDRADRRQHVEGHRRRGPLSTGRQYVEGGCGF
jgi:hypothetical protein